LASSSSKSASGGKRVHLRARSREVQAAVDEVLTLMALSNVQHQVRCCSRYCWHCIASSVLHPIVLLRCCVFTKDISMHTLLVHSMAQHPSRAYNYSFRSCTCTHSYQHQCR
jgi:hypothetical protein